jgi:hypothetical protein
MSGVMSGGTMLPVTPIAGENGAAAGGVPVHMGGGCPKNGSII